jgi:hypothetical protein
MNHQRAAELLSMLTAKVHSWEPSIREFDRLQREDVVLALAFVKVAPARLLARIKYADEIKYVGDFENELLSAIERGALMDVIENVVMIDPARWRYPRRDFLRDMCRMAIAETLSPKLCRRCAGHGFFVARKPENQFIRRACERCGGTGKRLGDGRYEEKERAELMNVTPDAWRMTWQQRYRAILSKIEAYEELALGGIKKRLQRA